MVLHSLHKKNSYILLILEAFGGMTKWKLIKKEYPGEACFEFRL